MTNLYLDSNARTRCDDRVVQAMLPFFTGAYGNPSAAHGAGEFCKAAVQDARQHVAALMNCRPDEVVFNSGGSEGDNTAILSALSERPRGHIICSACEHDAVLKPIEELERRGHRVTRLEPGRCGFIAAEKVAAALRPDTALVSVMAANNEAGSLNPVEQIGAVLRRHPARFHVDAVQCAGKVPLPNPAAGIDYMVISAHKFNGPPGVGAMMARAGAPYRALIAGGGQENKRRAGTENVPGIVGMGEAARLALSVTPEERNEVAQVRDAIQARIEQMFGGDVYVLCRHARRVPNTLLCAFRGVNGRDLQRHLSQHGVYVGTGSACSCLKDFKPSATVQALHVPPEFAMGTIRISLSRYHTPRHGFTFSMLEPLFALLGHFSRSPVTALR